MPRFIERDYADEKLRTLQDNTVTPGAIEVKKPRNVIRCADGYIEEYSTDDEQIEEQEKEKQAENEWNTLPYSDVERTKTTWSQLANILFWQQTRRVQWFGWGVGEFFGELFGITTPRYESEMRAAEQERRMREEQAAITQKCYVNDAGELEEHVGQGDCATQMRLPESPAKDTIKLDHKGQEINSTTTQV